ncbi:MAG: hypothetical protein JWM59_3938 [Verrucomicrobiales bacterium]|nr:hypothetical protein [Verrucomicrobiales bacterium]
MICGGILTAEPAAHSAHGFDESCRSRVVAQLSPQLGDVLVQGAAFREAVQPPAAVEERQRTDRRYIPGIMSKGLVILGVVLIVVGLAWPWLGKIPLFRLPGDIVIDRPGFKMMIPLTSMLLLSVLFSLLARWFR